MSGDYSRTRFDPRDRFSGVLKQQGRVDLDAEWNEYVDIQDRRWRAETIDVIGRCGVPSETPDGFKIGISSTGDLTLGQGRIYVEGLVAENHGSQPAFDAALAELYGTLGTPLDQVTPAAGRVLVYLDVWRRELTHLQKSDLIEPAVDVDTATRYQTAWRVRLLGGLDAAVTCATALEDVPNWPAENSPSAARLTTDTVTLATDADPCTVPPGGAYRGLENHLYRVEVHEVDDGTVRVKWSRENASVGSRVLEVLAGRTSVRVDTLGRDDVLRFRSGDWVEITSDKRELSGLSGEIRKVTVDETERTLTFTDPLPTADFTLGVPDEEDHVRVIRWDQSGMVRKPDGTQLVNLDDPAADGLIPLTSSEQAFVLEHGIQVTLQVPSGGAARTGDYWCFAARTAEADFERLTESPPQGIHHHYCKLAIVQSDGTAFVAAPEPEDCRQVFPPLTDIDAEDVGVTDTCALGVENLQEVFDAQCAQRVLRYVGGDGQQGPPGTELPGELIVGVEDGFGRPVADVDVTFTVEAGGGSVSVVGGAATTDSDGTASCRWTIGDRGENRVRAELSPPGGSQLPVVFHAIGFTAEDVALDDTCVLGVENLQAVFDKQCEQRVLRYVSGDGQEGPPRALLPGELIVGVEDGFGRPQAGVPVNFTVQSGGGTVSAATVNTDGAGLARCGWTLGSATGENEVQADLGSGAHLPVIFHAMAVTGEVPQQWPVITETNWVNDLPMVLNRFNAGLVVHFSHEMLRETVTASTFVVTLELPHQDSAHRGHYIFIVPGRVGASRDRLSWEFIPDPPISGDILQKWLDREADLFPPERSERPRLRCRVVLKGNTILDARQRPLDGDAFGRLETDATFGPYTRLLVGDRLTSGDGRKGGDFESWFWLVENPGAPATPPPPETVIVTPPPTDTVVPGGTVPTPIATVPTRPPLGTITPPPGGVGPGGTIPPPRTPPDATVPEPPPAEPLPGGGALSGRSVNEVAGIGPGLTNRLAAHGITDLAQLASLDPARLGQLVQVSEVRAMSIIDEARRLLSEGGSP